MGSSNFNLDQSSPIPLTNAFGNRSGVIESQSNDAMLLVIELVAGASVTAIELMPVVKYADGSFAPIHRQGDSGMIPDVMSIPVTAGASGQFKAVRVDTRGIRNFYLDGRVIGGAGGAITSIRVTRDGSCNPTPRMG